MEISQKCLEIVKKFEGFSQSPYACPAGVLTIGYGHVIVEKDKFEGIKGLYLKKIHIILKKIIPNRLQLNKHLNHIFPNIMTEKKAMDLLQNELLGFKEQLIPLIKVNLNENQLSAIISFAYNVGISAFKNSTLLRLINVNDLNGAAKQFDRWVYSGKRKLNGLIKRRVTEKELFLSP